ncbi:fatty acid desaturase family protein [Sphingomonas morindae]|uniref:Fatty acid desaturase family protein n=1 Tax=Sphingomonas morindae TaxID=1541170 RepID=A0ABY4X5I3_9SPHN|nr:fatty acid desaturase family protein [Sphingomonas morindae]USI72145.1 fatty acid desaturase family protein [Sphingomonas morindae]
MTIRLALAALAALLAVDCAWMLSALSLWMLPAALLGWYLADMMSGVVHMYMDYKPSRAGIGLDQLFFYTGSRESAEYLALRDRVFGQLNPLERLIYDFKNHHPRPDALGRRTMLHQIGSTILFTTLPFALLANAAFLLLPLPRWLLAAMIAFTIGASFAQYFHGTLHRADVPLTVRVMRRLGLLMQPADHVAHHATLAQDFSTINGWSNPVLNRAFVALRRRGYLPDEGLIPQ